MKISLTKPVEGQKPDIVIDVQPWEDKDAYWVIRNQVLGGYEHRADYRRRAMRDRTRYILKRHYLDTLVLAFPFAEFSPGIKRRIMRAETVQVDGAPPIDIPGHFAELYPFQWVAVHEILDRYEQTGSLLLENDEMGLGKTYIGSAVLRKLEATPCLVLCPYSAKWVWKRHLDEYTDLTSTIVDGTRAQRVAQIGTESHVTIINFESLRLHIEELESWRWPMVIVDEFHRLKNPEAQVTLAFQRLEAEAFLPLSGTMILNRPEESWVILNRLWPDLYPNYNNFKSKLVARRSSGGHVVAYRPAQMRKLRTWIHDNSIRRRREQVSDQLPDSMPVVRHVELLPEQRKLYNEVLNEERIRLENGGIRKITDLRVLRIRLKQACFSPELYGGSPRSAKVEEMKKDVEQIVQSGAKALIGSEWAKATRILRRELAEYNPAYVDGSVRGTARVDEQDRFMEDEDCKLFIGTIGANRESINLGEATWVLMGTRDWVPGYNDQFIGRSALGGLRGVGKEHVWVVDYYAVNTIEEEIDAILQGKSQIFKLLVEKDGGRDIPRSHIRALKQLFEQALDIGTAA